MQRVLICPRCRASYFEEHGHVQCPGQAEHPGQRDLSNEFAYAGVVSEGTLRPEDLKPKFFEVANALAPTDLTPVILGWFDGESDLQVHVAELIDFLDEHAPEGYHFGTHEGDGACFGFWKEEEVGNEG